MSSDKKTINPAYYDVIVSPLVTEKSHDASQYNKVIFNVATTANKPLIKSAVEAIFGVKVEKVNVINVKGKAKVFKGVKGKRSDRRKAVITLKEGENIDVTSVA